MKKWCVLVVVALLFLGIVNAEVIDEEVLEQLENNEEVEVIVILKEDPVNEDPLQITEEEKQKINENQEEVLEDFDTKATEDEFEVEHQYETLNMLAGNVTEEGLEILEDNPAVEKVILDYTLKPLLDVSSPHISAPSVHNLVYGGHNITGEGVTVCVLDSGIDYTHDNLGNCSESEFLAGNCSKVLGGYDYVNEDNNPMDDLGHGTHVAGIVASDHSTYQGIAYNAKLVSLKICSASNNCLGSDIIAGIDWCLANASKFNISIFTMSVGSTATYGSNCDASAYSDVVNQGYFFTISAGNSGDNDGISYPACGWNVTAVGAVNDGDSIVYNRASFMKLLAPGSGIISNAISSGFTSKSGTSMSAPHVAGAAALLTQYKRLESNINLTPAQIEGAFNNTGADISDNGNDYKRIDVFEALKYLDNVSPTLTFENQTPDNNSVVFATSIFINLSSNEIVDTAILEWNGSNESTNGSNLNFYLNKTPLTPGIYQYKVFGNDSANNWGVSETRLIQIDNAAPTVTPIITSTDNLNRTNGTLSGNWTYSDSEGNPQQAYEINWYNNSNLLFQNTTSILNGNTTKNEVWTYSIRAYDGYNWSNWTNTSITIQNSLPILPNIPDIIKNETDLVNINESGQIIPTDNDSDTLTITYTAPLNSSGKWQTNITNSGAYEITINVSDGTNSTIQNVTITIIDRPDFDNDGIPDIYDTDDDNDDLNDSQDFIKGNKSNVNTTASQFSITIDGSSNLSEYYNGSRRIRFLNNSIEYVQFDFNLSNESILDLSNVSFEVNNGTEGSIVISGVALPAGITKTFFLDNLSESEGVCIKDTENITSASQISSDCSDTDEIFLSCPGTNGQYDCVYDSPQWKITGLNHSGVIQQNDTVPPRIIDIGPTGTLSTTGTSRSVTLYVETNENATCKHDRNGSLSYRDMTGNFSTDSLGKEHEKSYTYTSDNSNETFYVLCEDIYGNTMNTTNFTTYAVDVGSSTSSSSGGGSGSSGGGGGGGGGGVKAEPVWNHYIDLVTSNEEAVINITNNLMDITEITFIPRSTLVGISIKIEKTYLIVGEAPGNIFDYYIITTKNFGDANISKVEINFRVPKIWISEGDYDKNTVIMKKRDGWTWTNLSTKYLDDDSEYYYYEATTHGFSYFAITAEKSIIFEEIDIPDLTPRNITQEEEKDLLDFLPWKIGPSPPYYFSLGLAIAITAMALILFIITLLRRRKIF
ncbi:S8 family serine peptidase [Nanoarchaeota archaeon]